jgi:hypothetical protein
MAHAVNHTAHGRKVDGDLVSKARMRHDGTIGAGPGLVKVVRPARGCQTRARVLVCV